MRSFISSTPGLTFLASIWISCLVIINRVYVISGKTEIFALIITIVIAAVSIIIPVFVRLIMGEEPFDGTI